MPFTGTSSNLTFDLLKEETDKRMSGFIPGETSMSNTVNIPAPDLSYAEMVASSDPRVQQQVQNIRESSRNKLEDQYTSFFKNPGQIMSDVDAAGNSYKKYIDNSLGYSSQRNNEDFYYKNTWENKSFTNKVVTGTGTFLGRVIPQAIMKLGSGLGYVGAMTGELFDEIGDYKNNNYWADVADNVVSTEIDKFEQYFKDYTLPVYHSEKYGSKGFFSKLGMADFWMDEGADASAFFLSALIPGVGMSKLGQLGKVGRLGKFGKVLSAEIPGAVGTLTGSGNVAELGAFVYNTSMEAAVESSHLYKENYEKYLKNHSEAEAKKMASTDAATAFQLNVGILAFSNAFENRLFHKIAGVNTSTRKPIVKVKETGNTLPTPALPEYKNKVSKFFGENSWGDKFKFVGEAILKEGFWEENLQTAIPRVVNGGTYEATERGTGKINKLKASDNIFSQGLKQIKDAYLGKDVEAETSIGLGALIGVVGSSSASLISGQYSKEKQLKNKILKELTDAREELFNVEAIYEKDDVGNIKRDDKGNPIINPVLLNAQQSKIKEMVSKVNSAHELSNNGQKEEANFLFKEVFSKYVLAHLKNGSYEAVINTLNNWGNKTDSELEIFGLEKELSNNPSEFIDLANQVKNIYVQSRNELKYDIPKGMKISEFVTKQENIANKLFDLKLTKYLTKDMQETIFAEILNNPQYKIIADISAIEAELKRVNEDTTTEDKTLVEANREILENQKKILKESNEFLSLDNETKKEYGKKVKKNNALHSLYFQLDNIEKSLKDKKTGIDYFDKEVDTQFDLLVDNLDKTQKEEKKIDDNFYYKKRIENENGEDIIYYDLYDNTKANIGSFNTEAEAIKEAKAQSQKIAEDIQKKTTLTSDELVKKREAKQEEDLSAMGTITDLDPKKETDEEEETEEEFTEVALLEILLENERANPEEFKEAFISAIIALNDLKENNRIDEFNLNREGLERLLNYFENNKDVDTIYLDYIKEINFLLGREIPEEIVTTTTVVAKDIPDTRVTLAIESPQKTVSRELEGEKMKDTTKLLSINGKDILLKVLKNNPYDSFVNALLLSPEIIDKLHRKEIQLALINDTEELVRIEGRFEEDKIPQILKNLGVVLIFVNKDGSEYIDKATGNKVVMNVDQNVFMKSQFDKRVSDNARKYERDEEEVRTEFKQLHQDLLNAIKQVKETGIAYPLDYVTISDGIIEYYTDKEFKAKNVPTITDYSKSLGEDIELEIKDDGGLVAMIDGEFLPISRFNIKDSVLNNGETILKIVSDLFNSEIQKENEQDIPEIKRSIKNLLYIDSKENKIIVSILDNGNFELMLVDINDNEVDIKEYLKTKRLNVSRALLSGKELLNYYIKNKDGLFEEQSYDTEEYIEMVKNNTYSSQKPYLKSSESKEFIFKTIQPYITFSVPKIEIKTKEEPTTSTEQQPTTSIQSIEAKKAEIERRRQEEFDQYANDIIVKTELYEDSEGRKYLVHTLKNGKKRLDTADEEGKRTSTLDVYESSVPPQNYIMGAKKISDIERQPTKQEKRINAKYDAELKGLEQTTTSNQSEIEAKKAEIERRRQEDLEKTNAQLETIEKNGDSFIRVKVEVYTTLSYEETLNEVEIITFKDGSRRIRATDAKTGEIVLEEKIKKDNSTTNEKFIESFIGNLDNSLKKISEDNNPNKTAIDKIYAKYNAELKALEQQPTTIEVIKAPQVVTNETSLADLLKMDMTIELEIKDTTPITKIDPTINQEIKEDPNC